MTLPQTPKKAGANAPAFEDQTDPRSNQPTISVSANQYAISWAAVSGASEP
ncbi:hypothetical protein F4695_002589 [Rhizobium soli]|uniref:Uncharacterized protein n=1 Tax=Rhizobium soli TaxID=424798 RepID=A0A7X0JM39_9HYPH|nr:hypothetical protein [Rhizobium soli]